VGRTMPSDAFDAAIEEFNNGDEVSEAEDGMDD
jgi:hypothetical protein